jgi:hypothetical protein
VKKVGLIVQLIQINPHDFFAVISEIGIVPLLRDFQFKKQLGLDLMDDFGILFVNFLVKGFQLIVPFPNDESLDRSKFPSVFSHPLVPSLGRITFWENNGDTFQKLFKNRAKVIQMLLPFGCQRHFSKIKIGSLKSKKKQTPQWKVLSFPNCKNWL